VLRELGERNDIFNRIHCGLTEEGWERGVPDFVLHGEMTASSLAMVSAEAASIPMVAGSVIASSPKNRLCLIHTTKHNLTGGEQSRQHRNGPFISRRRIVASGSILSRMP
jgi:hypothetical protein